MKMQRGRRPRRKVCSFCVDKAESIDYKDVAKLHKFVTERGKILPSQLRRGFFDGRNTVPGNHGQSYIENAAWGNHG